MHHALLLRPGACDSGSPHLSLAGRAAVREVLRRVGLEGPLVEPTAIVSAPSPACVQTAELAASALDYLGAVAVLPGLVAPSPAEVVLRGLVGHDVLIVVADEPFLSSLGAAIAGRPSFPTHTPGQASLFDGRSPVGYWRAGASMQQLLLA
ncbi:MAG: hypothetical protein IPQ09_06535 [Myxococcales bacterium]|nr:hypothetical protein [Myxococcales bacterium]